MMDSKNAGKFTNRLIHETSPYLRHHAHNPVNWFPWGTEAFDLARKENKPLFLSIGYSACHWCHVMERESFEDEAVAALLNQHFISIKVDREERPDLDGIYMTAVQMITGHGGWPMSVWLDQEGRPFYGGTYFPPADRHQLPSFSKVLLALADMWKNRRADLLKSATGLTSELEKMIGVPSQQHPLTRELLTEAAKKLCSRLDSVNGGFGQAPKFPSSMSLQFLLRHFHFTSDAESASAVKLSLDRMAAGGIYDHLGGGFSRYSVDAGWHVPHFEKMLYDNALLIRLYTEAWLKFGTDRYKEIALQTSEFILREMTHQEGGFYSTLDADSEGVEGKYYCWTWEEFKSVLPEPDFKIMCDWFDVSMGGNWEQTNVLRRVKTAEYLAEKYSLSVPELLLTIEKNRNTLFTEREKRKRPERDEKIITSWNGLMISALAFAGFSLNRKEVLAQAEKAAEWIWKTQFNLPVLNRVFKDGQSKIAGFSDDYGHFMMACVELAMYSEQLLWVKRAQLLADILIEKFLDKTDGGFYISPSDGEKLIVRNKDYFDNAEPSGHSSIIWALQILGRLTGKKVYSETAYKGQILLAGQVKKQPGGFGWMACSMIESVNPVKDLVLIKGKNSSDQWMNKIRSEFRPGTLFLSGTEQDDLPMLMGKVPSGEKTTLYCCENMTCSEPQTDPEKWTGKTDF